MDYTPINKDGKSYLHSDWLELDEPVCLKEYETLVEAQQIYSKLRGSRGCNVAYIYSPFQVKGKSCAYVAAREGDTSLQSFPTQENVETLFDMNPLTQRPYQVSLRYKRIVRLVGIVIIFCTYIESI